MSPLLTLPQPANIIICTAILLSFFQTGCKEGPAISNTEGLIRNDSIQINLSDSIEAFKRHKQLVSIKDHWLTLLRDTAKLKSDTIILMFKVMDHTEDYYKKVIADKNKVIFTGNRKIIHCNDKRPNVWLLITIVVLTGILGGIAGPRFSLLTDDDKETLQTAAAALETSKARIASLKSAARVASGLLENNVLNTAITDAETAVASIQQSADDLKRAHERRHAYLLFGLIASSLSFVALNLFNSKILDFLHIMDYFIFAGYCLLGAVFAKKWIVQLYDAISRR